MKFILNGFMALAFGLMFAQCAGNNNAAPTSAPAAGAAGSSFFPMSAILFIVFTIINSLKNNIDGGNATIPNKDKIHNHPVFLSTCKIPVTDLIFLVE